MAVARARRRRARAVRGARLRRPARRGAARSLRPRRPRRRALRAIHRPESMAELERGEAPPRSSTSSCACRSGSSPASARSRPSRKASRTTSTARSCRAFVANLPFPLTGDQQRTIDEITADMASPAPMHRLLQGDVGSGKTVVALAALLVGVQGGYQGAFMAPTEVLAEQHYLASTAAARRAHRPGRRARCSRERPVRVELLTNRTTAAERRRLAAGPRTTARSTSSSARTRCSTATPSSATSVSR